jgi:O-acetyl-ADP-ribose deacetylase (regulator of RNase III)
MTTGGNLKAKYVIHTVGPIWKGGGSGEAGLLRSCYRRSLEIASEKGLRSIAFPSISTGAYGYPVSEAAVEALAAVKDFLESRKTTLSDVIFVLFDEGTLRHYENALENLR